MANIRIKIRPDYVKGYSWMSVVCVLIYRVRGADVLRGIFFCLRIHVQSSKVV